MSMMDMIAPEDLGPAPVAEAPEPVLCRVCDTTIDSATGEPMEEVTDDAVSAVQEYMRDSGQSEEGGVALIDPEEVI